MRGTPLSPGVLMAHRGWPARYPENSLAGVRAALDAGAVMVEVDVQLTADGVPVVLHDATLARTGDRDEAIFDLPAAAVAAIDVGEPRRLGKATGPTPLPTLEATLALVAAYPGATLFIEAKSESIQRLGRAAVAAALLQRIGCDSRNVIIAADAALLERVRAERGLRIGWIAPSLDAGQEREAARLAPDFVFCSDRVVADTETPSWADTGQWVVYDVGDCGRARELLALGAAVIETDDIGAWLGHADSAVG